MKIDILLVDMALLALVLVPYVIFILVRSKTAAKCRKEFNRIAAENSLIINEKESWNKNLIGLDRNNEKLLLVQSGSEVPVSELVDLKMLKSCTVISETENQVVSGKPEEILKRVSLQFSFINSADKKLLKLYDHDVNVYQDYELKRAQKWTDLINGVVKARPVIKRAA